MAMQRHQTGDVRHPATRSRARLATAFATLRAAVLVGALLTQSVPVIAQPAPEPAAQPAAPAYFAATGYEIANPAFLDFFQKRGGLRTFGYPVSNEFTLLGTRVQLFQRQVLQVQPDGSVGSLNLLDQDLLPVTRLNGSTFPAPDPALAAAVPPPGAPGYHEQALAFMAEAAPDTWAGRPVNFGATVRGTVTCADAYPEGACEEGLLPALALQIWGLPTSRPAADPTNEHFVYQRFQRGILHYDQGCDCTQGLLLGDWFKQVLLGGELPADLAEQVAGSPFYAQYAPASDAALARPAELPGTSLAGAFGPQDAARARPVMAIMPDLPLASAPMPEPASALMPLPATDLVPSPADTEAQVPVQVVAPAPTVAKPEPTAAPSRPAPSSGSGGGSAPAPAIVPTPEPTATPIIVEPTPEPTAAPIIVPTPAPSANLAISLTRAGAPAIPGLPVSYTLTVANNGSNDVTGATVTTDFPAVLTDLAWACAAPSDSSCGIESGTGNISSTIDLAAGGMATYTITGKLPPSATGFLVGTAKVAPPSGWVSQDLTTTSATDSTVLVPTADLAASLTRAAAQAIPGQAVSYTLTITNNGPSAVTGATVTTDFPAVLGELAWACAAPSGSTCGMEKGTGNISSAVDLAAGATAKYTISGKAAPSATGSLVGMAKVALPSGWVDQDLTNNSATDSAMLVPTADLAASVTDGAAAVPPGSSVAYTVVLTNNGPSAVTGAMVSGLLPNINSITWTCAASAGSACSAASGADNLAGTVDLAPNGTATYSVKGSVDSVAAGSLSTKAMVQAPAGVTDPTPSNNSASDTDALLATITLPLTPLRQDVVKTLPDDGSTEVWNPRVTLGNHTIGGCNGVIDDLIGTLLIPHLHIVGGQDSFLRAVKIHERFSPNPGNSWDGRTALQNDRGQIYGGGEIGGRLICAGGASNTNGAYGSGTNPAPDFMDYQNKLNSPDSSAQNPLGGLELVTAQSVFGSVNPQTYEFDPIFNTWDVLDDMPKAVVGAAQRAVGAKHYVIGGRVPGSKLAERLHGGKVEEYREVPTAEPCVGESQDLIQVLDPTASPGSQWETLALPKGQGRSDAAAVVVKDKILVIGGCRVTWNDSKDFAVTGSNPVGPAVALSGKFTGNADVLYMLKVASLDAQGKIASLQVSRNGGMGYQNTVTPILDAAGNPTNSFGVGGGITATVGASGLALVGDTYAFTAKGQNVEFLRNIDIFDPSTDTLKPSGALLPSARADAAAAANGLEVHVLGGWRLARGYVGAIGTAAAGGEQDALVDEAAGDTNHVIFDATVVSGKVDHVSDSSLRKGEPLHMTCSNNTALGSGYNRVELVAAVIADPLLGTQLIAAGGDCRSLQGFNRIAGAPGDPASGFLGYPPRPAASVDHDDKSSVDTLLLK